MNEYAKDYGKVGLTFEHYLSGKAVEELTLVAYQGELYVSLRGTVMNDRIPTASDDWYRVSTFGDLLEAIRQVRADAEQLKLDIEAIKADCERLLATMQGEVEALEQDMTAKVNAMIQQLTTTDNDVKAVEQLRATAEEARAQAETLRVNAEDIRVLAESVREDKESQRQQAEDERVNADNLRKEDWAHLKTDISTTIQTANEAAARAVAAAQQVMDAIVNANNATEAALDAARNANTEAGKVAPMLVSMQEEFNANEAERQRAASDQRKSEKQTFDTQIEEQDAIFLSKETERDLAVEEATKVADKVAAMEQPAYGAHQSVENIVRVRHNDTELPTLCGQPMILFGKGTPQEAVVPDNWKQYDPVTGEGYQWNGSPSALGQVYINTEATGNGRYTAVENGYCNLKWLNF